MTTKDRYFTWMCSVINDEHNISSHYHILLSILNSMIFTYTIDLDSNREADGRYLRYQYGCDVGMSEDKITKLLDKEMYCSVLEMMVALAIRCEHIMDNPEYGNRTSEWFWGMIRSLGLITMTDDRFNEAYVRKIVERFLNREYQYDGKGSLFTVKNPNEDLRDVEIWCQMCWFLDQID